MFSPPGEPLKGSQGKAPPPPEVRPVLHLGLANHRGEMEIAARPRVKRKALKSPSESFPFLLRLSLKSPKRQTSFSP